MASHPTSPGTLQTSEALIGRDPHSSQHPRNEIRRVTMLVGRRALSLHTLGALPPQPSERGPCQRNSPGESIRRCEREHLLSHRVIGEAFADPQPLSQACDLGLEPSARSQFRLSLTVLRTTVASSGQPPADRGQAVGISPLPYLPFCRCW